MAFYLLKTGPLSVAADATMWQFYYSGVWFVLALTICTIFDQCSGTCHAALS